MLFIKFIVVFCLTKIGEVMEKKKNKLKENKRTRKKQKTFNAWFCFFGFKNFCWMKKKNWEEKFFLNSPKNWWWLVKLFQFFKFNSLPRRQNICKCHPTATFSMVFVVFVWNQRRIVILEATSKKRPSEKKIDGFDRNYGINNGNGDSSSSSSSRKQQQKPRT